MSPGGGFLLCLFVTVLLNYTPALPEKISSKLDFGLDSSDKIEIKSDSQILEARNLPTRSPDDGNKHVVCSESGCNTTEVQKKTNGILTDVLVHVQTSGGGTSTTVNNDTIPDVPVIVGYGGTSPPSINSDSLQSSRPLIVTNIEEVYPNLNRRVDQDNTFYSTSNPSLNRRVDQENIFYSTSNPSLNRRVDQDNSFYSTSNPSLNRRVDQDNTFYSTSNPSYGGTTQTFVAIPGDNRVIPSSYNNKQAVWYPKNGVSFNPIEFKRFNNRPVWSKQPPGSYRSYATTTPSTGYTTCMCQNSGLNWYPTTPTWRVGNQKVGYARPFVQSRENEAHIDDKLGSFN